MILKLLAVIVVLFIVYTLFFKKSREKFIKRKDDKQIEDEMVECPTCSVYVSKKEALLSNGDFYCSKKCLLEK